MTRAALLIMSGDPFLNAYWFNHYRTWADQVDELRVIVCDMPDPYLQAYMRECVADLNVTAMDFWPRTDHGIALGYLMAHTDAETVLLMEDDAFVRQPGRIGDFFADIERGETDVVGCPRATGTPEIISYANNSFGVLAAAETGEQGPLLWPTFLFARHADLMAHSRNFSVWGGTQAFGQTFSTEQAMDTFGWASLELRHAGKRIKVMPNYRAQLGALGGWGSAPWFHVGGLSVGHGLTFLQDRIHRPIEAMRGTDLHDWEKRVSWWQRVSERGNDLPDYRARYREALEAFIVGVEMNRGGINDWRAAFNGLITWPE